MLNRSLVPTIFKKNLEPFRSIESSFNNLWRGMPLISYVEEGALLPNIDVVENDKGFQVTADVPGLEESDINIEFNNGILTLRGEKKTEKKEDRDNYHLIERSRGYFNRTVQLPGEIDGDKIEATMKNGVLRGAPQIHQS
jgi:HSP20 family molecular chaperone IbpA